ncbi:hypothetical protein NESM_000364300 [Novymonas esmeraldas]|uniref:Uncharacterized protein n=1 Tax=Novymonas esmeraldas TaxID=1808958 RepID=A0AAW0EL43_9TRYP
MMRCFGARRARTDVVELLVRQGRLADVQLLNFFSAQLNREVAAAATETATAAAAAAAAAAATVTASAGAEAQTCGSRTRAWTDLDASTEAVRRLVNTESPVAWLKEVFGAGDEWSSSYLSAATAVATRASDGDAATLTATGVATAVGSGHSSTAAGAAAPALPKSIRVVLRLESSGGAATAAPQYVTASVPLDQPGVVERTLVQGVLQVRLSNAKATHHASLSAEQVASYQHTLTATAYSAILQRVEEVCALHATHTVRYDSLLIRNPATQMRLAQLACFRYGISCLTDYVVGDRHAADGDAAADLPAQLQLPLVESMTLNVYAERALLDGIDAAWEMVRDTPLVAAVPHRSNAAKKINYPYLSQLFHTPKYLLASSTGSMEEQAMTFLSPVLAQCGHHGGSGGGGDGAGVGDLLQRVMGLTAGSSYGGVRLAAPHVNLAGVTKALEEDIATLLNMMVSQKDKSEPNFVLCAAQYISEVFASLAVVYRCTAALNIDEEGRGHREWLMAQVFGSASAVRRRRILDDYTMARAASTVIQRSKSLDSYATHPIELMNATPRKAASSSTSSSATR